MNCKRCHHTDSAHDITKKVDSFLKVGKCMVPGCTCMQYLEPIDKIDEDLM